LNLKASADRRTLTRKQHYILPFHTLFLAAFSPLGRWILLKRKIFLLTLIAVLTIAIPLSLAALTYQVNLPASIIINPSPTATPTPTPSPTSLAKTISIQICDLNGNPLSKYDFGSCRQQGAASCQVLVKNTGNVPVTLSLTATGVALGGPGSGEAAGAHGDWLTWDSEGANVAVGGSAAATLRYSINMVVGGYDVERAFNIVITATETS
jgi:hypothetical protein